MNRSLRLMLTLSIFSLGILLGISDSFAAAPAKVKGLGDPGTLKSFDIGPVLNGKAIQIRGRDARQQLFVTGKYSSGQLRDLTHQVKYTTAPAEIISIDATGLVTPIKDGDAKILVSGPNGLKAEIPVHVEGFAKQIPINFKNQIVPIFTKLGCNSGGCHGKASGQNGFKFRCSGFIPKMTTNSW